MDLDALVFIRLIEHAAEQERRDVAKQEWNALLPFMSMKFLKAVRFDEYYRKSYGMEMDTRPDEDILAEAEDIRRKITEEQDGPV